MHTGLHVKWLSFVSDFYGTLIIQTDFLERPKYKIYNLIKICKVGVEYFNAERRTDGRTPKLDEAKSRI